MVWLVRVGGTLTGQAPDPERPPALRKMFRPFDGFQGRKPFSSLSFITIIPISRCTETKKFRSVKQFAIFWVLMLAGNRWFVTAGNFRSWVFSCLWDLGLMIVWNKWMAPVDRIGWFGYPIAWITGVDSRFLSWIMTNSTSAPASCPAHQDNIPLVCVVDDDLSCRRGLERLLRAAGIAAESYASGSEYLSRPTHVGPLCLVLTAAASGNSKARKMNLF